MTRNPVKAFENTLQLGAGNTGSAILHAENDRVVLQSLELNRHIHAVNRVLDCIVEDVGNSRAQFVGIAGDMIANGLVKSVARPDGNITGISLLSPELNGKRQDIIIEAVSGARRMAILAEANNTTPQQLKALQDAGRARGIELAIFTIRTPEDIAPAMNEIKMSGAAAINVLS